jgi:protein O-GlcNAc transferase
MIAAMQTGNQKIGRNERCPCGSMLKFKNCCGRTNGQQTNSLSNEMRTLVAARCIEGFQAYQRGLLSEAERICKELLSGIPELPDATHLLGMIRAAQGMHEEAVHLIDQAILSTPQPVGSMFSNKALSLKALNRMIEADTAFRRAVALDPDEPRVRKNFGLLLMDMGKASEARVQFEKAIRDNPGMADVWGEIALTYAATGDWKDAEDAANKAIELDPRVFNAHSALSTVYCQRFDFGRAAAHFEAARELDPNSIVLLENYTATLTQTGRAEEARAVASQIFEKTGKIDARIRQELTLPVLYNDREDLFKWRRLREVGQKNLLSLDPVPVGSEISHLYDITIFYLAFHGMNDVDLMVDMGRLYRHLIPDLSYISPHLHEQSRPSGRMRIGFFCRNVGDHPITHCFSRLFTFIAGHEEVEAFLISTTGFELSRIHGTYRDFPGAKIDCPVGFQSARELVASLQLDIIIYTDIGMDALSYFMASCRLARVQCSLPGHPVTTGISNVDYYITPALAEPENAEEQYSESLLLLENNFVRYPEINPPDRVFSPEEIGLPPGMRYYFCPVMLQKMHYEFDSEIASILRADERAIVVMFQSERMPWVNAVTKRLSGSLTQAEIGRVLFLPYIEDKKRFLSTLACADVVLDSFHFGLGSTFAFVVAAGVPYVSWPGETIRGRTGLYMARLLGLPELICADRSVYARRAVEIAQDMKLRETVRSAYSRNKGRLFDAEEGMREFYESITSLIRSSTVLQQ